VDHAAAATAASTSDVFRFLCLATSNLLSGLVRPSQTSLEADGFNHKEAHTTGRLNLSSLPLKAVILGTPTVLFCIYGPGNRSPMAANVVVDRRVVVIRFSMY